MRKSVLFLCVVGFASFIVGIVLALPSVGSGFSQTIQCSGTIVSGDGSPQQVSNGTSLDLLGYAVILASIGFFVVAFVWNKRSDL